MIFIDAGQRDMRGFDARLVFAMGLRRAGFAVGLDDATLPDELHRTLKYEAQSYLVSRGDVDPSGVVVVGAQSLCDATLSTLRRYDLGADRPVVALGHFQTRQARLGSQAKIAYATGAEPELVDLFEVQPAPLLGAGLAPLVSAGAGVRPIADRPRVLLFVPEDMIENPEVAPALALLGEARDLDVTLISSAKGKNALAALRPARMLCFAYSELSPFTLAAMTDIAVALGDGSPGARFGQICAQILGSGGVVIDGTQSGCLVACGGPIVRGPASITGLAPFLAQEILPRRDPICAEVAASGWVADNTMSRLTERFPIQPTLQPDLTAAPQAAKTLFLPTNGVGLGHAQRCVQIAREMPTGDPVEFAAFPSCVELAETQGFDCNPLVQKSDAHADPYANDIVNYRRLSRWLDAGDRLVFDGVYVFDSIYRTILEKGLDAVWIRRGLWRSHQTNVASLDREHCFSRVIVPQEAFDELNQHYSFGGHIHHVGPIVQKDPGGADTIKAARDEIARQLDRPFKKLVVSMLGGGVAADRGPQLQTICAALERRPDVLHLVVVWPNAKVAPELSLWSNTKVVHSLAALRLARAADFVISAVGYNSFHEILYHQIPSILIPQTAPYMDDQERRARAAVDRGLAEIVLPDELLRLDRLLADFLDTDRAEGLRTTLEQVSLPDIGNGDAAGLIRGGPDAAE